MNNKRDSHYFFSNVYRMEFKEIRKKNGELLVFCRFEDLLLEFFKKRTISEVESELKGSEYIIHCPFCKEEGHTKHKLYIKSDLTVGHCFVCGRNYINATDDIKSEVKLSNSLTNFGITREGLDLVRLSDPTWSLDKFNYEFDDSDIVGEEYLERRHKYLKDLYKLLNFKFLDGNIVMPFYHNEELFYYQIRFSGKSSIKYFFPPISSKPPWILRVGNSDVDKVIICEGIFDAIACLIMAPSYTPCAVLGSSISDYQISFIREFVPNEIVIFMDETKISVGIANKLRRVIDYCPIRIIASDGEDPEERMKRMMKKRPGKEVGYLERYIEFIKKKEGTIDVTSLGRQWNKKSNYSDR